MIALALLLALQVADTTAVLAVRTGEQRVRVPLVQTRSGPLVRAAQALAPLGVSVARPARDRAVLTTGSTRIELTIGLPYARIGTQAVPLGSAPVEREGELFVPAALLTDVLPTHVPGFVYDRASTEVRRLTVRSEAPAPRLATVARPAPVAPPVVVVDAGHGGPDRGMSGAMGAGQRLYEADVTLAIAKRLRDELRRRGVRVVMTRSTDTLIALEDRPRIANREGGELFLSIHVNAANPRWRNARGARGFETYFLAEARTEDEAHVAATENEAARFDPEGTSGDPLRFLLNDMLSNAYFRESSELAASVQRGLAKVHPGTNRGVKQAGFVVLVTAAMPAVLIETGFGTNAAEARWLASAKGQQSLAEAIADATMEYLAGYQRRRSAGRGAP